MADRIVAFVVSIGRLAQAGFSLRRKPDVSKGCFSETDPQFQKSVFRPGASHASDRHHLEPSCSPTSSEI